MMYARVAKAHVAHPNIPAWLIANASTRYASSGENSSFSSGKAPPSPRSIEAMNRQQLRTKAQSRASLIKKNYKKHVPLHPLPMPKPRRALATVAKFSSAPGGPWPKPTPEWKEEQKRIKVQYAKDLKEWRAAKKSY